MKAKSSIIALLIISFSKTTCLNSFAQNKDSEVHIQAKAFRTGDRDSVTGNVKYKDWVDIYPTLNVAITRSFIRFDNELLTTFTFKSPGIAEEQDTMRLLTYEHVVDELNKKCKIIFITSDNNDILLMVYYSNLIYCWVLDFKTYKEQKESKL